VVKGGTQQFSAVVNGTGSPAQTVDWSVEGGVSSGTVISPGGLLTVDAAETAASLTVRATSTVDPAVSGTAAVTVTGPPATVTGVSVSPLSVDVVKGFTQQFAVIVSGTNNPAQTVTWSIVESHHFGTTISTDGLFTVDAAETATSLTVRAASTVDPGRDATASVTVQSSLNSITEIITYLATAAGNPVSLPVSIDLAAASPNGWEGLLAAIQASGRNVALNLSGCTMSGTEFDPGAGSTGTSQIVSLTLPAVATHIKAGTVPLPTFRYFTGLKSVNGQNIEYIGGQAFLYVSSLTELDLPKLQTMGHANAFYNCTGLTTLNLPEATEIGDSAFSICNSLAEINLPKVVTIFNHAFRNCPSLTTVSLPEVTTIGVNSFGYCTGLTMVSLPKVTAIDTQAFRNTALTTITIGPGCAIAATDSFPNGFKTYYDGTDGHTPQAAGTYTWNGTTWDFTP
jgi:hypothetical protein